MRKRKGQSILEYVIILSVIVAAIAIASQGVLRTNVNNLVTSASTSVGGAATRMGTVQ